MRFALPAELSAHEPPEARGLARDEVRLLVAGPEPGDRRGEHLQHATFREIGDHLNPGDLLVVNTSATLAAAVDGRRDDGTPVAVHFSTPLAPDRWLVELRSPDGAHRVRDARDGETVTLPAGVELVIVRAGERLSEARVLVECPLDAYLDHHGRPITYGYLSAQWPLSAYQTVFARDPGSAEMPSAGRPFTAHLVTDLVSAGIAVAPIMLHTGVSSPESGETPLAERFTVPEATARLVNATRRGGGRVIAVGTTVTRALESVAAPDGLVHPGSGWTELVLGPDRPARVVNGLVTGWHEAGASHLLLLEAVAGRPLVEQAYDAALTERYLWHEFGDSCLLLPHS
jgi:S-adenosylmethionine:tRNA ribosyltransferase-isomerase